MGWYTGSEAGATKSFGELFWWHRPPSRWVSTMNQLIGQLRAWQFREWLYAALFAVAVLLGWLARQHDGDPLVRYLPPA